MSRFILRRRGRTLTHPVSGRPYVFPSYTAAVRGRAMIQHDAEIVRQELAT